MQKLFRIWKQGKSNSVSSMSETSSVQSFNVNNEDEEEEIQQIEEQKLGQNPEPKLPDESSNDCQEILPAPSTRIKKKGTRFSRHKKSSSTLNSIEPRPQKPEASTAASSTTEQQIQDNNGALPVLPPIQEENNAVVPDVAALVDIFETKLLLKCDPVKPIFKPKRSLLTRKRSKSWTSFHHSQFLSEEAKFQGDSIEHVLLNESENRKPNQKEDKDRENDIGKLVIQLLDLYKPKITPPVEAHVYTIDSVQYDCKVSPYTSKIEQIPYLDENIPRQALNRDDGTQLRRPWPHGKASAVLDYIRDTAANLGADRYAADEESTPIMSASMESLLAKSTLASLSIKKTEELPRGSNFRSCLEKQKEKTTHGFPGFSFSRNNFVIRAGNNHEQNSSVRASITPVQNNLSTSAGNASYRFPNMAHRSSIPADTNNNQTNLLPSTSSSEDSVMTSIHSNFRNESVHPPRPQHQPFSEYAFQYRPPKAPPAAYATSKTSTRDGSTFGGSFYNSIRDSSDDERRRLSIASSSRNYGGESIKDVTKNNAIIEEATYAVNVLLSDLRTLWCCVSDKNAFPTSPSSKGLLELVGLCSYVVKEMEGEWQSLSSFYPDRKKLDELSQANRHLRNRLEQATLAQNTLQAEIGYMLKEKGMMATEVKELSMQLAASPRQPQAPRTTPTIAPQNGSPSNCSLGFNLSLDPEAGNRAIKKREEDFNSLMECVRVRGNDMHFYKDQLEQYDQEVDALHRTIEVTKNKQVELENAYSKLTEENKIIVRERGHFEQILKLILKEKESDGSSLHDLLQTLISKLNQMDAGIDGVKARDAGLMEGALQAVQEQNSNYRDEVQRLKEMLSKVSASCLAGKCQEEASRATSEYTSKLLEEKNEVVKHLQKSHEMKYSQLQEIHDLVAESKAKLDRVHAEKCRELKKTMEDLNTLQKASLRHQRKIQELQKLNNHLSREIQEHKHNIENLNKIVTHLRSTLSEKNDEWSERARINGEETIGMKDQCKWLQSQIDILTQQLADAHDRMKGHERDKGCLAQQVLNAEEERKVVDRKLQELRAAFQGDSALRKALMERNEALQVEISRLRRTKLMNLEMSMNKASDESEFETPPSEMSMADPMSIFHALPHSTTEEKHGPKKNRYTATAGYEEPRAVASMHSASDRGGSK